MKDPNSQSADDDSYFDDFWDDFDDKKELTQQQPPARATPPSRGKQKPANTKITDFLPRSRPTSSDLQTHQPNFNIRPLSRPSGEPPTHHALNAEALNAYIYPTNYPIRDYQRNIISKSLTQNIICAVPTGLGKTFIASVVMLNWYRWTTRAKIIFVAPTRPLVTQQVRSVLEITGISVSDTCILLQDIVKKPQRQHMWESRRVFFATPQTVENDLKNGLFDPKDVVCLVVDEAHRSTGNHSYVNLVKAIKEENQSFRILALTATPSSKLDGVQEVVDNLQISGTEIRSEDSLDVQQYTHVKDVERVIVELDSTQCKVLDYICKAVQPLLTELSTAGVIPHDNARSLHPIQFIDGMKKFAQRHRGASNRVFPMRAKTSVVQPVALAISMLQVHGIYQFYQRILETQESYNQSTKPGVNISKIVNNDDFQCALRMCKELIYTPDGERSLGFYTHPKARALTKILREYMISNGADSRAIIFTEYRESAAEILWTLEHHAGAALSASIFVGQSQTSRGVKGMTQKEQQKMLDRFKAGEINVLIATSVAEEGLDIGQVDLIICYDQSKSPIRSIQRMGRTGRARDGKVYMLMTSKELSKLDTALLGHKYLQNRINKNDQLQIGQRKLIYHPSPRILPEGTTQVYEEIKIETPKENSSALEQGDIIEALRPEQKRRRKAKEAPNKKQKSVAVIFETAAELTNANDKPAQYSQIDEIINLSDED